MWWRYICWWSSAHREFFGRDVWADNDYVHARETDRHAALVGDNEDILFDATNLHVYNNIGVRANFFWGEGLSHLCPKNISTALETANLTRPNSMLSTS